jgi:hypothetical protein
MHCFSRSLHQGIGRCFWQGITKEDVMGNRGFRIFVGASLIALLAAVAAYWYNAGVARGIAEARILAAPAGAAPVTVVWPRPWGFGVGFVPMFPLFFILFWVLAFRRVGWRRGWGRRGYGDRGVPPAFEERHRRAHRHAAAPASDTLL